MSVCPTLCCVIECHLQMLALNMWWLAHFLAISSQKIVDVIQYPIHDYKYPDSVSSSWVNKMGTGMGKILYLPQITVLVNECSYYYFITVHQGSLGSKWLADLTAIEKKSGHGLIEKWRLLSGVILTISCTKSSCADWSINRLLQAHLQYAKDVRILIAHMKCLSVYAPLVLKGRVR